MTSLIFLLALITSAGYIVNYVTMAIEAIVTKKSKSMGNLGTIMFFGACIFWSLFYYLTH